MALQFLESFPLSEVIAITIIFAVALPSVAFAISRKATQLFTAKSSLDGEMPALTFCLFITVVYLAIGSDTINAALGIGESSARANMIATLLQKLTVFVGIPLRIFSRRFGFTLRDLGLSGSFANWREHKHLRILISLSALMILFQLFVGQAAQPVRSGEFGAMQLLIGLPLAFVLLVLQVGLVEEFFFRALIQSRIAARLNSETAGIVIGAVLFGLAHAPGLILRAAGAESPVGADPSMLLAVCYSIVVLSAAGLFLSIVWSRTRNLWLIVLIHAVTDLLPNFAEFAEVWGIS
jgi:membrane protease YdiL (CAAX protease family)